jgi:hypothetical protein
MPYDDVAPTDIARMQAMLRMQQAEPTYDDGEYLLGADSGMQQVGLFGKGRPKPVAPVDLARRSMFGLSPQAPLPDNLPAVRSSDVPVPNAVPSPFMPVQPTPAPQAPAAPLESLISKAANTPVSRREVLKKAGQVALNQALPTPKVTDVVPEIVSPLAQAANIAQPGFIPNDIIDTHLRNYVQGMAANAYEQEPGAVAQGLWIISRDYLKNQLPKETVQELDALAHLTKQGKLHKNSPELSDEASHELFVRMQNNMRKLKPHELADVLSNLHQEDYPNAEIYENIAEHFSNALPEDARIKQMNKQLGLKPKNAKVEKSFESLIDPHEFDRYIEQSWEHSKVKKEPTK